MKNLLSAVFILLVLSGCENKATAVDDEEINPPQHQEDYAQGKIETHSTE